jgi:hypothetical protein
MKLKIFILAILFAITLSDRNFFTEPDPTYFGGWVNYKISNITDTGNTFEFNPTYATKPGNNIPSNETFYIEVTTSSIIFFYDVYDSQKSEVPLTNIIYKDGKIISANDPKCFELLFKDEHNIKKLKVCLHSSPEKDACLSTIIDLRARLIPGPSDYRFKADNSDQSNQIVTTTVTTTTTFNPSTILPTIENSPIHTSYKDCESKECYGNILRNEKASAVSDSNLIPVKVVMNLNSITVSLSNGGITYMVELADIKGVKKDFNYPNCFIIDDIGNQEFVICEMKNVQNCSSDEWIKQITRFKSECQHSGPEINHNTNVNHPIPHNPDNSNLNKNLPTNPSHATSNIHTSPAQDSVSSTATPVTNSAIAGPSSSETHQANNIPNSNAATGSNLNTQHELVSSNPPNASTVTNTSTPPQGNQTTSPGAAHSNISNTQATTPQIPAQAGQNSSHDVTSQENSTGLTSQPTAAPQNDQNNNVATISQTNNTPQGQNHTQENSPVNSPTHQNQQLAQTNTPVTSTQVTDPGMNNSNNPQEHLGLNGQAQRSVNQVSENPQAGGVTNLSQEQQTQPPHITNSNITPQVDHNINSAPVTDNHACQGNEGNFLGGNSPQNQETVPTDKILQDIKSLIDNQEKRSVMLERALNKLDSLTNNLDTKLKENCNQPVVASSETPRAVDINQVQSQNVNPNQVRRFNFLEIETHILQNIVTSSINENKLNNSPQSNLGEEKQPVLANQQQNNSSSDNTIKAQTSAQPATPHLGISTASTIPLERNTVSNSSVELENNQNSVPTTNTPAVSTSNTSPANTNNSDTIPSNPPNAIASQSTTNTPSTPSGQPKTQNQNTIQSIPNTTNPEELNKSLNIDTTIDKSIQDITKCFLYGVEQMREYVETKITHPNLKLLQFCPQTFCSICCQNELSPANSQCCQQRCDNKLKGTAMVSEKCIEFNYKLTNIIDISGKSNLRKNIK